MSDEIMDNSTESTDAPESQATSGKTYTQEEFDQHMAGLRKSMEARFEKRFAELGDIEELRTLKTQAEKAKEAEALKRGEFEKILQEKAAKFETELRQRDAIIHQFKVDTPLLQSAAKQRAVNPEQVQSLLKNQVRLGTDGDVEIVDINGVQRYKDSGAPLAVDDLVQEFLNTNPHFQSAAPATSGSKNSVEASVDEFSVDGLDMKIPSHRQKYAEWKRSQA